MNSRGSRVQQFALKDCSLIWERSILSISWHTVDRSRQQTHIERRCWRLHQICYVSLYRLGCIAQRGSGREECSHVPRADSRNLLLQIDLISSPQPRSHARTSPCPAQAHSNDESQHRKYVQAQRHRGREHDRYLPHQPPVRRPSQAARGFASSQPARRAGYGRLTMRPKNPA